jgi:hypothetical protein
MKWPAVSWCREQGLYPSELDAWKRDAIAGLGEPRAREQNKYTNPLSFYCVAINGTLDRDHAAAERWARRPLRRAT